jgi:hypothetical protein
MPQLEFLSICGQLLKPDCPTENPNIHQQLTGGEGVLERIKIEGETKRPLTHGKAKIGKTVGHTIQQICFICRRYLNIKGNTTYAYTTFWCKSCHMPLCYIDFRCEATGRELMCEQENSQSAHDSKLCCRGQVMSKWAGIIQS